MYTVAAQPSGGTSSFGIYLMAFGGLGNAGSHHGSNGGTGAGGAYYSVSHVLRPTIVNTFDELNFPFLQRWKIFKKNYR